MFNCKKVTNKYSDWSREIIWMTSYFTLWMFLLFGIYYINLNSFNLNSFNFI